MSLGPVNNKIHRKKKQHYKRKYARNYDIHGSSVNHSLVDDWTRSPRNVHSNEQGGGRAVVGKAELMRSRSRTRPARGGGGVLRGRAVELLQGLLDLLGGGRRQSAVAGLAVRVADALRDESQNLQQTVQSSTHPRTAAEPRSGRRQRKGPGLHLSSRGRCGLAFAPLTFAFRSYACC